MGFAAVAIWTVIVSWMYFFTLKRTKSLKMKREEEILGLDAINDAKGKGINLKPLLLSIHKKYPELKRKGC